MAGGQCFLLFHFEIRDFWADVGIGNTAPTKYPECTNRIVGDGFPVPPIFPKRSNVIAGEHSPPLQPANRRPLQIRFPPGFAETTENKTHPYGEFISPSSGWIETEPPRRIASGGSPLDIPTAKCYNNRQDAAKRQAVQSFRYGVPQKGVLP